MPDELPIRRAEAADQPSIVALLTEADLLTHDVLAPGSVYWVAEDAAQIVGIAGVELGGHAALLRSVAVLPGLRSRGLGRRLVDTALAFVADGGYRRVYLFSTRSGGYWQALGFARVPVDEVARALPYSPQVVRFAAIGKLVVEVAWRKDLR